MAKYLYILLLFFVFSCKKSNQKKTTESPVTETEYIAKDTITIESISSKDFREFKVLDSKYIDFDKFWEPFNIDLEEFTEDVYNNLKPLILEQDIPTIQKFIYEGKLSYKHLTKFYLYRIRKYDRENPKSLNSIIALNPNIIEEARQKDNELLNRKLKHPIFGMPILLKDNINALGMSTTAGAVALQNNITEDAFIVEKLKQHGALILGKANLSEWAYFFCGDCPSGYSAIGGQTLNPYGRRIFDTGGSSSGSGVGVAANFCVAAIGSETSGSILSPASQNSVVGFKPTIGLLSRGGIIPISSTLDTPGPMTKNVMDNAILMDVLFGEDKDDNKSIWALWESGFYTEAIKIKDLKGIRFGAFKRLLKDSLYVEAISKLKLQGAEIIEIEEEDIELPDFLRLLNLDMKKDLPKYLENYAEEFVEIASVKDVINFNKKDSLNRMPYGQKLFEGIVDDKGTEKDLNSIKETLYNNGKRFFDLPKKAHNLDGFLSINNDHAGFAAVAEYPAITVPMGYDAKGVPKGLTFIGVRLQEKFLLQWAYAFEQAAKSRKFPENYN